MPSFPYKYFLGPFGALPFFGDGEESIPAGESSQARFQKGPARVVREKFTLVDDSRPTPSYNNYAGSPERVLKGELWRPGVVEEPTPLVVYSHGLMSFRQECSYLGRFLASHGYTVVAVNYPLTGIHAPSRPYVGDIVNQPADVSAVIDHMFECNADPGDAMYDTIDAGKIAAVGLSLGGLTSILAAYHCNLRDPRIDAAVSIAGPTSIFTADFFADNATPLLMIHGDADSFVPYDEHAITALPKVSNATLVTLADASHAGFAEVTSTFLRFLKNPDSLSYIALHWAQKTKPWDFLEPLGGPDIGINPPETIKLPTSLLIPETMKAGRQQMFTMLATHAYLDSLFGNDASTRNEARNFLQKVLPRENATEVSVSN